MLLWINAHWRISSSLYLSLTHHMFPSKCDVLLQTMTFYEGGEASNGEASTMLDASASSAVETPAASDASTVDATPNPTE